MAVTDRRNNNVHKNEDDTIAEKSGPSCDPPRFELLDLRAEVSSFLAILADFAFIVLYLLALPLQLVDEVVFDDGESGCRVVCQCLHHCGRIKKKIMDVMLCLFSNKRFQPSQSSPELNSNVIFRSKSKQACMKSQIK